MVTMTMIWWRVKQRRGSVRYSSGHCVLIPPTADRLVSKSHLIVIITMILIIRMTNYSNFEMKNNIMMLCMSIMHVKHRPLEFHKTSAEEERCKNINLLSGRTFNGQLDICLWLKGSSSIPKSFVVKEVVNYPVLLKIYVCYDFGAIKFEV